METPALTVSQLNQHVRYLLEDHVGEVEVIGELSNFKNHMASGHCYFTLKDANAQLRCAFFRQYNKKLLKFSEGNQVIARGLLSLYETRGDYQLIVYELTLCGIGELHQQFDLLKRKLEQLGLFSVERKRSLPKFPQDIGVITSAYGAALQDILVTLKRRYPLAKVHVYASEVQGINAAPQLIAAIAQANLDNTCDVLILARGGGSIEDLWAFNQEALAYAIFSSQLPIVTGIGHESDVTISDLVADLRAATPTAAAEAAAPNQLELLHQIMAHTSRLTHSMKQRLTLHNMALQHLQEQLMIPIAKMRHYEHHFASLQKQLVYLLQHIVLQRKQALEKCWTLLSCHNPQIEYKHLQTHFLHIKKRFIEGLPERLNTQRQQFNNLLARLHAVSPLATLARGYAIVSYQQQLLYDCREVDIHETVQVRLAHGELVCQVLDKKE